ncbi:hypothetical protein V3131_000432 [Neisseria gonorrhoeae]
MPSETGFRRHLNKRGNQAVGSEKPTSARLSIHNLLLFKIFAFKSRYNAVRTSARPHYA